MYIDVALINDFQKRYPNVYVSVIEEIFRAETEDFEMTLEEICSVYYYIIDKNTIKFCNPDQLWEDIEEYLKSI